MDFSASVRFMIFTVLIIAAVGQFATDVYLPSLPAISDYFSTGAAPIQMTITLYLLGYGASNLVYGPLSDYYGRKRILMIGLAVGFVASIVCTFAPSINILILGRLLQGMGFGACIALSRALMRDMFSGTELAKAGSYLAIFISMILAVAPIIGGYLEHYLNWRASFAFLLIYAGSLALFLLRWLPETNAAISLQSKPVFKITTILNNYRDLLFHPIYMGYTLISSLTYAGIIAYISVSPFLLQKVMGLTPTQNGWLSVFNTATFMTGAFINARLVTKLGIHRMILIGISLKMLAGCLLLINYYLFSLTWVDLIIPFMIFTAGAPMLFANASSGAITPFAHMAGAAGALFSCMQISVASIASGVVAVLHENNPIPLAMVFIMLATFSAAALFFITRNNVVTEEVETKTIID